MLMKHYVKMYALGLLRNKSAAFFTLILPALLLLLFSHQVPNVPEAKWAILATMSNYAVQTSLFQALGMAVAHERQRTWTAFLKVLPVGPSYQSIGRVLAMLMFAIMCLLLVMIVGLLILDLPFNFYSMGLLSLVALLGGIPMGFLGVYLGKLVNPTAARSLLVTTQVPIR